MTSEGTVFVVDDDDVRIVVELMGGSDLARDLTLRAIEKGKHVVTANKALIALHGNEIFEAARRQGKEAFRRYHLAVLRERHQQGQKLGEPETLRALAAQVDQVLHLDCIRRLEQLFHVGANLGRVLDLEAMAAQGNDVVVQQKGAPDLDRIHRRTVDAVQVQQHEAVGVQDEQHVKLAAEFVVDDDIRKIRAADQHLPVLERELPEHPAVLRYQHAGPPPLRRQCLRPLHDAGERHRQGLRTLDRGQRQRVQPRRPAPGNLVQLVADVSGNTESGTPTPQASSRACR